MKINTMNRKIQVCSKENNIRIMRKLKGDTNVEQSDDLKYFESSISSNKIYK